MLLSAALSNIVLTEKKEKKNNVPNQIEIFNSNNRCLFRFVLN